MPIAYERDDLGKRAVITFRGAFDAAELLARLEEHRIQGAWPYALLYDLRQSTDVPSMDVLREIAQAVSPRAGEVPRGPVAVVVSDPTMYARACTYAAMSRARSTIEVFRNRADAEAWLSSR